MSDVNDNGDVFLSFELASCRGIGSSNARHADSGGCEGNSESTSHNFSFRRVHRACWTPTLMLRFGRAPTRGTIRRSSVVAGSARAARRLARKQTVYQRDERAPFHCSVPPPLRNKRNSIGDCHACSAANCALFDHLVGAQFEIASCCLV